MKNTKVHQFFITGKVHAHVYTCILKQLNEAIAAAEEVKV